MAEVDEERFKPEVHAFFLAPFLDQAEESVGRDQVLSLLAELNIEENQLRDASAWVSLRFAEQLVRVLHETTRDPLLGAKAGRAAFSAKYMGPLRTVIRAFGDPGTAYVQMAQSLARFNKVGDIQVDERSRGRVVMSYRGRANAPREREVMICRGREANMAALPTLFDLPPARVEHPQCMHVGGDVCEYVVTFQTPQPKTRSRLAILIGLLAGGAAGFSAGMGMLVSSGLAFLVALGLWALMRQLELRDRVTRLAGTIVEQQDALVLSTKQNEERFEEVVLAKAHVEERIEERTAQLEQALDELRALDEAKTQFFSNVSHELRTPLTLILSPLTAMRDDPNTTHGVAIQTMEQNARRLLRMINQLLDLAKVDAKKVTLNTVAVGLPELLRMVVAPFKTAAKERGIRLELSEVSSATLELDASWMESALSNLIANALRFARSQITLSACDLGGEIVFSVTDDGSGIPAEHLPTIFERFAQVGSGGTGLGLAIVREAARLHGGRASVDCEGEGTTFSISLPRVVATGPGETLPPAELPVLDPVERNEAGEVPGPYAGAPTALVVEDHPELRRFVADVLSSRFHVLTTSNGADGLRTAREKQPNVVITDVMMPKMGGHELCRELRKDPITSDIPVLLVTARGEPQDVIDGFDAGADDYLVKPFHGRELLARIDAQLRLRTMLHRLAHNERLASLGVLAASVAHQVRNPLTALVSGLPAVRKKMKDKVDPRTAEMLDVFIDCSDRIERITLDLLDLSRVDREEEGDLNPGQGLMSAVRLTCAQLPGDVEVTTDVDETTTVRGRAGDLNHVFLNLLDNASRAVERKGRIAITGKPDGSCYRVSVEDDGQGVPAELGQRIFEPFVTSRDNGEGTGLGLAIVSDIVKSHGGTIRVERSAALGGAKFIVELRL